MKRLAAFVAALIATAAFAGPPIPHSHWELYGVLVKDGKIVYAERVSPVEFPSFEDCKGAAANVQLPDVPGYQVALACKHVGPQEVETTLAASPTLV